MSARFVSGSRMPATSWMYAASCANSRAEGSCSRTARWINAGPTEVEVRIALVRRALARCELEGQLHELLHLLATDLCRLERHVGDRFLHGIGQRAVRRLDGLERVHH